MLKLRKALQVLASGGVSIRTLKKDLHRQRIAVQRPFPDENARPVGLTPEVLAVLVTALRLAACQLQGDKVSVYLEGSDYVAETGRGLWVADAHVVDLLPDVTLQQVQNFLADNTDLTVSASSDHSLDVGWE